MLPNLDVIQLRDRDGFTEIHAEDLARVMRLQVKFRGQGRIDGGDLRAGIQQEGVWAAVVDGHIDDILRYCARWRACTLATFPGQWDAGQADGR